MNLEVPMCYNLKACANRDIRAWPKIHQYGSLQKRIRDELVSEIRHELDSKASCLGMHFIVFIKVMLFGKQSLCRCSDLSYACSALQVDFDSKQAAAVCVVQCSRSQSSHPDPLLPSLSGLLVSPKHRYIHLAIRLRRGVFTSSS
jgi:hypothetical protein